MSSKPSVFNIDQKDVAAGVPLKIYLLKRRIISSLAQYESLTVSELASMMGVSTPTIAKLLGELIAEGCIRDMGKVETSGGRRPCSFSLVSKAGYFLGVEVGEGCLRFALVDLNRNVIGTSEIEECDNSNSPETINKIVEQIQVAISNFGVERKKILGIGLIIRGRVDSLTGHSYGYLNFSDKPISEVLSERLALRTIVENDTRAIAYAEHILSNEGSGERGSLFLHLDRGVGVGIIINGELYYGKSGFAGEFGHIPFFENEIICHCGKKGCLETEVSGMALERIFTAALKNGASSILSEKFNRLGHVSFTDIIEAASNDDVLSIELIGQMGEKLGRGMGVLLNLFNPEAIIVGGALARAGDYLMLPLRSALAKYSLSLVNNDSVLRLSTIGKMGSVIGGALLTRSHVLAI